MSLLHVRRLATPGFKMKSNSVASHRLKLHTRIRWGALAARSLGSMESCSELAEMVRRGTKSSHVPRVWKSWPWHHREGHGEGHRVWQCAGRCWDRDGLGWRRWWWRDLGVGRPWHGRVVVGLPVPPPAPAGLVPTAAAVAPLHTLWTSGPGPRLLTDLQGMLLREHVLQLEVVQRACRLRCDQRPSTRMATSMRRLAATSHSYG